MKSFNLILTERQIDIIRSAMGVATDEGLDPNDSHEYEELINVFKSANYDVNRNSYWRIINR